VNVKDFLLNCGILGPEKRENSGLIPHIRKTERRNQKGRVDMETTEHLRESNDRHEQFPIGWLPFRILYSRAGRRVPAPMSHVTNSVKALISWC